MGSLFGGNVSPGAPPVPPPAPNAVPTAVDPAVIAAGSNARAKAAAALGASGTIVTGPQGLVTPASTAQKALLGG